MANEPKQLDELFHDTLKDIYFAEKKILTTLPKMTKAAENADLTAAFEKHRAETEGHVKPATAPCAHGPKSLVSTKRLNCLKPPSRKRKPPTRR